MTPLECQLIKFPLTLTWDIIIYLFSGSVNELVLILQGNKMKNGMCLQSLLYQLVVKSKGALLDSTLEYLLDFPDFARHFVPPLLTFHLKEEVLREKEFTSFTISHLISRFVENSNDCVWVISSDPGRGKSTVVKELAHQLSKQQKYVWKIELRNFYPYQDKPASFADLSVSEFLSHELPLAAEKIAHILENEKAFVFLDGFDEICSDIRRHVLKLIGELIKKKASLLIASRPQEETEISNALQGIRAKKIHILPLDRNQQIKLLQLQPKNKKSKEECKEMLEDFARLGLSFFIANPIQLTLLAQVEKATNLFDIYDKVVDLKIENEMKVKEECVKDKEPIFEDKKEARKNILNEVALKMLNGESVKMKPRETTKLNRTGIAAMVGGRLHFVHHTFAEFLVVLGYITELKDKGVSNINIFDNCSMNCRQFLDDWLSVRKDTENEVWNKVVNDLKSKCTIQILKTKIVEENQPRLFEDVFEKFSIQDLIKEGILDVALSKSGGITSKLLEYEESQNYLRENEGLLLDVSNTFPLEVYEKMKSICPKMMQKWVMWDLPPVEVLAVVARRPGRLGMLEFLANNGCIVNGLNGAALHNASEYGVVENVELLLSFPGIEIDWPDGEETAMHYAARGTGDPKIAELLWKKGFNLDALDQMDRTPLHKACQKGNVDFVKFLLEKGAKVDLYDDYERETALHFASENGHFECVELLLKSGAEVNETDKVDRTALHWACEGGHLECVELLLNSKAQIDLKDNQDKTALNLASEKGNEKVVKLLLLRDCDVQSSNDRGSTALQLACKSGETICVRNILNNKADINVKDEEDETVLHYAARGGSVEIMKMLLARNPIEHLSAQTADEEGLLRPSELEVYIDQKNIYGKTALHVAAKEGKLEVLKTILEAGANVTVVDENGWNAIHFATSEGKLEVAQYLNEVDGSLITEQTNEGETALHLAAADRNFTTNLQPSIYNWLVETCVDTKATDKRGWNALHRAAKEGNLKAAKLLCEKEPSLMKMETKKGETALHLAAEYNRDIVAICEWLLFNDVSIDAVDDEGWNAIHKAIRCNNFLVAEFLHKKDVNLVKQNTKKGETALHLASMVDYETSYGDDHSLFEWVLKQTNDFAAVDDEGWTALHHAVRWGDLEVSKLLLEKNEKGIEMKTKNGETALHLAVMRSSKSWNFCNVLIKKGVDVKAVDKDGKNALHRAIERNSARVAKLLLQKEDQNLIMLTTDNGDTCLHLAASVYIYDDESKRKALYQWLKENGEDGRALKMAIKEINKLPTEERARKAQELEESLIKKKTEDGSSALDLLKAGVLTKHDFHSVDSENFECCCLGFIEWLLENQIDPHAVNKDGKTALECANSTFVKEYLSRKMK